MATYEILVRDVSYKLYRIDAENEESAEEVLMDGGIDDFEYVDGGSWDVVSIKPENQTPIPGAIAVQTLEVATLSDLGYQVRDMEKELGL
jgi:hypothetical protein